MMSKVHCKRIMVLIFFQIFIDFESQDCVKRLLIISSVCMKALRSVFSSVVHYLSSPVLKYVTLFVHRCALLRKNCFRMLVSSPELRIPRTSRKSRSASFALGLRVCDSKSRFHLSAPHRALTDVDVAMKIRRRADGDHSLHAKSLFSRITVLPL